MLVLVAILVFRIAFISASDHTANAAALKAKLSKTVVTTTTSKGLRTGTTGQATTAAMRRAARMNAQAASSTGTSDKPILMLPAPPSPAMSKLQSSISGSNTAAGSLADKSKSPPPRAPPRGGRKASGASLGPNGRTPAVKRPTTKLSPSRKPVISKQASKPRDVPASPSPARAPAPALAPASVPAPSAATPASASSAPASPKATEG